MAAENNAMGDTTHENREFLTFLLAGEEYGIDILKVQEIREYEPPTPIANAPAFIKGVINLRGNIVPIVDLRIKFNFAEVEYSDLTVVIILNIAGRTVGVVVDGVSDVLALKPGEVKPAPEFGSAFNAEYLTGLGTVGDRMLILVDIQRLMTSREIGVLDSVAA